MVRAWVAMSVLACACWGVRNNNDTTTPASPEPAPVENKHVAAPPRPPPPTGIEAVMMKMEEFTRDMCACAPGDAACAKQVSDDMVAWSREMAHRTEDPPKISDADQQRFTEIGTRMGQCMQTAISPPTP